MKHCIECDKIMELDYSDKWCSRCYAIHELTRQTGLTMDDLPDGLQIEDFIDDDGNLEFDGISAW